MKGGVVGCQCVDIQLGAFERFSAWAYGTKWDKPRSSCVGLQIIVCWVIPHRILL